MTNDPIADFLTRIRNASMRRKKTLDIPVTKEILGIAKILKEEGYILGYEVSKEDAAQKNMQVMLGFDNEGGAKVRNLTKISKPGLRKYMGYREIPKVLNGMGISIFSTPKGIMTGKNAKVQKVGGEFLCKVW